jgi:hypothetical protein
LICCIFSEIQGQIICLCAVHLYCS